MEYSHAPFIQAQSSLPCHGFEPAVFEQLPSQSTLLTHPQPDPYDYQIKNQPPMIGEAEPVTWFDIDAPANLSPSTVLGSLPLTELEFFRGRIWLTVCQIHAAQITEASKSLLRLSRWRVVNLKVVGIATLTLLDCTVLIRG